MLRTRKKGTQHALNYSGRVTKGASRQRLQKSARSDLVETEEIRMDAPSHTASTSETDFERANVCGVFSEPTCSFLLGEVLITRLKKIPRGRLLVPRSRHPHKHSDWPASSHPHLIQLDVVAPIGVLDLSPHIRQRSFFATLLQKKHRADASKPEVLVYC